MQLRNAVAVKLGALGRKEGRECLLKVCLIGEELIAKMVVQRMGEICWLKFRGMRWVAQCFPAKSMYIIPGHHSYMRPGVVSKEQCTLAIHQCSVLLPVVATSSAPLGDWSTRCTA